MGHFETYERFIVMIEKKTENFIQLLYMFKLSEIMYEEFLIKKNVNYQKNRYGFSKYISDDYNFGYFGGRLRIKVDDENLKMMENLFKIIGSLYIHKNNLKTSLNEPIENIIHELWLNVSELVKQNHG